MTDHTISFRLTRLRAMMFLQYAVYGLWLPLASRFLSASPDIGGLGFNDRQIGFTIGVAGAVGAIASPFIAGQLADRWFSTQRCMAVLLIVGGFIKFLTAYQTSYSAWLWLSIAFAVVYMPTLALSNSLTMNHLDDSKRQFPGVRVWGTIAWIVVSWVFPMIWLQQGLAFQWLPPFFRGEDVPQVAARMLDSVRIAGILAVGYGLFCWFALPDTPPKKSAAGKPALLRAASLMKFRSVAVLVAATLFVSAVHFLYFTQTSKFLAAIGFEDAHIMPVMSIGQIAEIAALGFLGLGIRRLGFKTILLIGTSCYVARYLIFGLHELFPLWVIAAAQVLHGPCFACFFAASFIYVDRMSPPDIRNSAQTFYTLVYSGLGFFISGYLNGALADRCRLADGTIEYRWFWFTAAGMAMAAGILITLFFRDEADTEDSQPESDSTPDEDQAT
jgi:nucleoside transporter